MCDAKILSVLALHDVICIENIAQFSFLLYICPMIYSGDYIFWSLVSADCKTVGREWSYRNVCSPFTRIYYVIDGEGEVYYADRVVSLRPGFIYIIPAFTRHTCMCRLSMTHIYLHLYEPAIGDSMAVTDRWTFPDEILANASVIRIIRGLVDFNAGLDLQEDNPEVYDNRATLRSMLERDLRRPLHERVFNNGLIALIMAEWFRVGTERDTTDARISAALSFIHNNYKRPIMADECAACVGLSRHHFGRLFKAVTGTSVGNYIILMRIRKACSLLKITDKPVNEIARTVGYDDSNYFTRLFKKSMGLAPLDYRHANI